MKIAVVGGGITGLSAAYYLSKKGHRVALFEKKNQLGGLASGVKIGNAFVDKYYRHIFTGDRFMIDLIGELGLDDCLVFKKPQTAIFYQGRIYPFTSAPDLLRFTPLSFVDRLRFGLVGLCLKMIPGGQGFASATAESWLKKFYGSQSYKVVWEPLLSSKFGPNAADISMAWFWSRVHDRTFSLGYLQGGFQILVNRLAAAIKDSGGEIHLNAPPTSLADLKGFDKIIVTTPLPVFLGLAENLPQDYESKLETIKFRSALSMILFLKRSFIGCYWLNVNDEKLPFVAVVEHTNYMHAADYGGKTILYVGSYLGPADEKLNLSDEALFDLYLPHLQKINPAFDKNWLERKLVFRGSFAQPIVTTDYAVKIPPFKTPLENVYLATMAQVYPQDRGMNQAVELGKDVAEIVEA